MAGNETVAVAAPRPLRVGTAALAWALAGTVFALLALAAGIVHDEEQYVAAAQLALGALPYRDFAFLQTPLQPLLFAPLAALDAGLRFPALRLASAATALAGLGCIYAAQRRLGVEPRAAAAATALVAFTHAFVFGAAHARNDMLPMALLAAAIWAAAAALERPRWWLAAGLLAGAATCAKISYGPPAGALAMFMLLDPRARRWLPLLAAGGLAGAAPGLLLWVLVPEQFMFGNIEYNRIDPVLWYAMRDMSWRFGLPARAFDTLTVLARGPALVMLAMLVLARRAPAHDPRARRMLDLLIAGALIGALLPAPSHRQYFIPLLPPLAVAFGLLLQAKWPGPRIWALLLVSAAAGAVSFADLGRALVTGRWAALDSAREAQWIGATLAAEGASGPIATLSPRLALDSDVPLDPRFAAGPFLWRTGDRISPERQAQFRMVSPATLAAAFAAAPPGAIVTGYEGGDTVWNRGIDLEAPLAAWASAHGYRAVASPVGAAVLYIRP